MKALCTPWFRLAALSTGLAGVMMFSGCTHIGPQSVTVDRFDYSTTIADSWKQQTLLNIVKLRYMDLPVFVDVASIVAGYSLETGGNLGGQISSSGAGQIDSVMLGASSKYTDRPTVTYVPLTGEKFLLGLLSPIDPKNIFSMLQAGYPADFILALTVESINGVRNRATAAGALREADPEFLRVLELLRDVQGAGAVGMRVDHDKEKGKTAVVFLRSADASADTLAKQQELRRLLHLSEDRERFQLKYSPVRGEEGELAVNSRSMLQIMSAFSSYMEVPEEHLRDNSAIPSVYLSDKENSQTLIHNSKDKPERAYAAVHYRDHWFWIDDTNWQAKRALTAVMFFFTLADTGEHDRLPLITIPAQ